MKPSVRVFTKESPCTKLDIWQCFRGPRGFVRVGVPEAHAVIGTNVPRVMERNGRLFREESYGTEYYTLTSEGQDWLLEGFHRYLKNHPRHVTLAKHLPADWGLSAAPGRLRRTR